MMAALPCSHHDRCCLLYWLSHYCQDPRAMGPSRDSASPTRSLDGVFPACLGKISGSPYSLKTTRLGICHQLSVRRENWLQKSWAGALRKVRCVRLRSQRCSLDNQYLPPTPRPPTPSCSPAIPKCEVWGSSHGSPDPGQSSNFASWGSSNAESPEGSRSKC